MINSFYLDGCLYLTRADMRQRRVFHAVGVSYLSVICRYLRSIQIVEHQLPFCF